MRKRLLALVLGAVVITTAAATGAVSATATDNTSIRQFDILWHQTGVVIGTLTIDTNSGHYTVNINPAKVSEEMKTAWQDLYRQKQYEAEFFLIHTKPPYEVVPLGNIALTNVGGNLHGQGTLDPTVDLKTIAGWNEGDVSVQFAIG